MEIITKPKKWGNSLGLIIPKKVVERENITEATELIVNIKKERPIKEVFGILKDWKIDTRKARDDSRKSELEAEKRKWGG